MKALALRAAVLAAMLVPGVPSGMCLAQEEYQRRDRELEIVNEMTPGEAYKVKSQRAEHGQVVWVDSDRDLELVCRVVRDPAGGVHPMGGRGYRDGKVFGPGSEDCFNFRAYVAEPQHAARRLADDHGRTQGAGTDGRVDDRVLDGAEVQRRSGSRPP